MLKHIFSLLIRKMAMTRKERDEYAKNAYIYVIEEFLGDKIGGNIEKALTQAGCQGDIRVVVTLSEKDVDNLQHEAGEGIDKKIVHLTAGSRQFVRILIAFYCCKVNGGEHINTTWLETNSEEFETFRMTK